LAQQKVNLIAPLTKIVGSTRPLKNSDWEGNSIFQFDSETKYNVPYLSLVSEIEKSVNMKIKGKYYILISRVLSVTDFFQHSTRHSSIRPEDGAPRPPPNGGVFQQEQQKSN
jgi:hypothetical protein